MAVLYDAAGSAIVENGTTCTVNINPTAAADRWLVCLVCNRAAENVISCKYDGVAMGFGPAYFVSNMSSQTFYKANPSSSAKDIIATFGITKTPSNSYAAMAVLVVSGADQVGGTPDQVAEDENSSSSSASTAIGSPNFLVGLLGFYKDNTSFPLDSWSPDSGADRGTVIASQGNEGWGIAMGSAVTGQAFSEDHGRSSANHLAMFDFDIPAPAGPSIPVVMNHLLNH